MVTAFSAASYRQRTGRATLGLLFVSVVLAVIPESYSTLAIQSSFLPINSGVVASVSTSDLNTEITSARDGTDREISNGGSTTSDTMRFMFRATSSQGNVEFQCSLNAERLKSCGSPWTESDLEPGGYLFEVKASDSRGLDQTPAEFRWTVEAGDQTVVLQPRTTVNDVPNIESNAAQAFANSATQTGNTISAKVNAENVNLADSQAIALNPVLKTCDPRTSDYAVYDITGEADFSDLLTGGPGITTSGSSLSGTDIPISLIIFNDQKPTDQSNQIINNVQPFLKGMVIAFPGIIDDQRTTPFHITKVTTQCIATVFSDTTMEIQPNSEVSSDPDLTSQPNPKRLNPIFGYCNTATGNLQTSNQALAPLSTGSVANPAVITPPNLIGSASQLGSTSQFNTELASNAIVASTSSTVPSAAPLPPEGGGNLVDVAKYTIEGMIQTLTVPSDSGQQDITFRVYSVFNPDTQLPGSLIRTGDTNNKWIAAKIEIEPGDPDEWQSLVWSINSIDTKCNSIPFVDGPKAIGTQAQEFYTIPTQMAEN